MCVQEREDVEEERLGTLAPNRLGDSVYAHGRPTGRQKTVEKYLPPGFSNVEGLTKHKYAKLSHRGEHNMSSLKPSVLGGGGANTCQGQEYYDFDVLFHDRVVASLVGLTLPADDSVVRFPGEEHATCSEL